MRYHRHVQVQPPYQPVDPRQSAPPIPPAQADWAGTAAPAYAPYNDLQSRLMAQAHSSRSAQQGLAAYFIVPAATLGGTVLYGLFLLPIGLAGSDPAGSMAFVFMLPLLALAGTAAGGFLGYFLALRSLRTRYERARAETLYLLQHTELPLLIADEGYCAGLLDMLSSQNRFLFTGPPSIRRLEDQLSIAACYVRALLSGRFLADEVPPSVLKHGSGRWWTTTPSARSMNLLASLSFCLIGYCGCLLFLPLLRNILVLSEQRGTLAAICEYFAGAHEVRNG